MKKKVDSRIRTLIENGVKTSHRSMFVLVGDKARDQVVNLHYMLSKATVRARPSVLWCYKKELYLSSHKKKRMKQVRKLAQRGLLDPETEDPFSLFVASTSMRYCYYSDTQKILGNTYGMCVLQDFEGLTPNLLARTVETVEGGGLVVLLVSTLKSLTQLFTLSMDVHARLQTESHQLVRGRFNERLVLSLAGCQACILADDELNVLPTSTHVRSLQPVAVDGEGAPLEMPGRAAATELGSLKEELASTKPIGPLCALCKTLDQGRALMTFMDAASDTALRGTVALTASRGRGKSAAMGLAVAGAVAHGYTNIFVTAPSPENLRTLFEFVFKGLEALEYKEHLDYDLQESTNPAFNKAIVRVNVFRSHRQVIQYVQPQHHNKLGQAELLVIDEAAAIPLPLVRKMLGPYLVFLCSTVNGYEGTGRSLSLKLISQLREQSSAAATKPKPTGGAAPSRSLREVSLEEPIRYGPHDPVEAWLCDLLCLNAADALPPAPPVLPHPNDCELLYVERDTLFSGHRVSEVALQRMMALYVASHYKNTPNDLLLLSDAPAHHLFVLAAPVTDKSTNQFPDIFVVLQVALEGAVSRESSKMALASGQMPQGDLLSWIVAQQFQDPEFPSLSGVRVVRIATHPAVLSAGYGSKAMQELRHYYEGCRVGDVDADTGAAARGAVAGVSEPSPAPETAADGLRSEVIKPRALDALPPLFTRLQERRAENLHFMGVSFGMTTPLLKFWRRQDFQPVYLRQTVNETSGESSCVMLRVLENDAVPQQDWLSAFNADFQCRFLSLQAAAFREMEPAAVLTMLQPKLTFARSDTDAATEAGVEVRKANGQLFDAYDLQRLHAYCNNVSDVHAVLDLVPCLARAFFSRSLPATQTPAQAAILVVLGLQHRDLAAAADALQLPGHQVLTLLHKAVKRFAGLLRRCKEAAITRTLPKVDVAARTQALQPHALSVEEDLDAGVQASPADGAAAVEAAEPVPVAGGGARRLEIMDVEQFAIHADDDALMQGLKGKVPKGGRVQVPAGSDAPKKAEDSKPDADLYSRKRKGKHNGKGGNGRDSWSKKSKSSHGQRAKP